MDSTPPPPSPPSSVAPLLSSLGVYQSLQPQPPPSMVPCHFNAIVLILVPVFVLWGLVINGFSLEVLQSPYLADLPSQPIIKVLLTLQCALIITGPLYMWLTQIFGAIVTVNEVYTCVFIGWFHDFLTLSTSWLLAVWMMERAVTIAKPKETWAYWRMKFCQLSIMVVGGAIAVTLTGSLVNRAPPAVEDSKDSACKVCLPWLDQDRIVVTPGWYRLHSLLFSLVPCQTMFFFLVSLVVSIYSLSFKIQKMSLSQNLYQSKLMEVRNAIHLKFVYSLLWIGPVFFMTCAPIGVAIYSSTTFGVYQGFATSNMSISAIHQHAHVTTEDPTLRGVRIDFGGVKFEDLRGQKEIPNTKGNNQPAIWSFSGGFHHSNGDSNNSQDNSTADENNTAFLDHEKPVDNHLNNLLDVLLHGLIFGDSNHHHNKNDNVIGKNTNSINNNNNNNNSNNNSSITLENLKPVNTPDDEGNSEQGRRRKRDTWAMDPLLPSARPGVNVRCVLWLAYYSFSLMIVPIMITTEPLFRREWRSMLKELKTCCCYCSNNTPDNNGLAVVVSMPLDDIDMRPLPTEPPGTIPTPSGQTNTQDNSGPTATTTTTITTTAATAAALANLHAFVVKEKIKLLANSEEAGKRPQHITSSSAADDTAL